MPRISPRTKPAFSLSEISTSVINPQICRKTCRLPHSQWSPPHNLHHPVQCHGLSFRSLGWGTFCQCPGGNRHPHDTHQSWPFATSYPNPVRQLYCHRNNQLHNWAEVIPCNWYDILMGSRPSKTRSLSRILAPQYQKSIRLRHQAPFNVPSPTRSQYVPAHQYI